MKNQTPPAPAAHGSPALAPVPLLGDFCMDCQQWEPRDAMKELGYMPSSSVGYCPIFSKLTEARHGTRCTAYVPNVVMSETDDRCGGCASSIRD